MEYPPETYLADLNSEDFQTLWDAIEVVASNRNTVPAFDDAIRKLAAGGDIENVMRVFEWLTTNERAVLESRARSENTAYRITAVGLLDATLFIEKFLVVGRVDKYQLEEATQFRRRFGFPAWTKTEWDAAGRAIASVRARSRGFDAESLRKAEVYCFDMSKP